MFHGFIGFSWFGIVLVATHGGCSEHPVLKISRSVHLWWKVVESSTSKHGFRWFSSAFGSVSFPSWCESPSQTEIQHGTALRLEDDLGGFPKFSYRKWMVNGKYHGDGWWLGVPPFQETFIYQWKWPVLVLRLALQECQTSNHGITYKINVLLGGFIWRSKTKRTFATYIIPFDFYWLSTFDDVFLFFLEWNFMRSTEGAWLPLPRASAP